MRVAIIQARTGSTRLPGKILNKLGESSVIEHVYGRVSQAREVDKVVIAIPNTKEDDALARQISQFCSSVSRGSESDVLARYMAAAEEFEATTVIRITSDCPFFDPDVLDAMILEFDRLRPDYMTNTLSPYLPRGLDAEVFKIEALRLAYQLASKPHQREHVTPYIYENKDRFSVLGFKHLHSDNSDLRWTLDTSEDWKLIKTMHDLLEMSFQEARYADFLRLYDGRPDLRSINGEITQKTFKD